MRKNIVIIGVKTNEEADKVVLEVDDAVREITAALDCGKIRPSAPGLVSDASGLVRDASGLGSDSETAARYKDLAKRTRDLCREVTRFSRYCRQLTDLARNEDPIVGFHFVVVLRVSCNYFLSTRLTRAYVILWDLFFLRV